MLTIHAEGSLASQRMTLYQQADWDLFKAAARHALKIPTDHPAFKEMSLDAPLAIRGLVPHRRPDSDTPPSPPAVRANADRRLSFGPPHGRTGRGTR